MKLFVPNNIFSSIFISSIPNDLPLEIIKVESALLTKQLKKNNPNAALIPSLGLINHRTLFVSSKIGIAFDGVLSNTYYYFSHGERKLKEILMRGDLSINEVILSKILFEERYSAGIDFIIDTSKNINKEKDYLVVGNENYHLWDINKGISFTEQVTETLNLPYVNYLMASYDKEQLKKIDEMFANLDASLEDNVDKIIPKLILSKESGEMLKENHNSVYYKLTSVEIEAVNELIQFLYYRGIIDDIFDVKFS